VCGHGGEALGLGSDAPLDDLTAVGEDVDLTFLLVHVDANMVHGWPLPSAALTAGALVGQCMPPRQAGRPAGFITSIPPIARRMGPFATMSWALPPVDAVVPCSPNSGMHIARTTASTTGWTRTAPRHDRGDRDLLGSDATTPHGFDRDDVFAPTRAASRNDRTSFSVGGTIGSPSV